LEFRGRYKIYEYTYKPKLVEEIEMTTKKRKRKKKKKKRKRNCATKKNKN